MIKKKVLLWDIDGVLITPSKFASSLAIEKYGLDKNKVNYFFKYLWPLCVIDKIKLIECLPIMLATSEFENKETDYIDFWFKHESEFNQEIFQIIREIKRRGIIQVIASNQEILRTKYVWDELKMCNYFDAIYTSSKINIAKPNKDFFIYILNDLNIEPEKVVFIDDDIKNVEAAIDIGITAHQYSSTHELNVFLLDKRILI